ncbi:MAG TPA: pentapeptide repeat-containing protein, partial [Isosphaeraceae bacterium]|nr:pentapeptide repeat-containing protein [Isosphaeraceae bacterium]
MTEDELDLSGSDDAEAPDPPVALSEKQEEIVKAHEAWLEAREPKNHAWKVRARIEGDWTHADLRGRDLRDADCRGADLQWADFTRAKLEKADFRDANLRHSRLAESIGLSAEALGGTDLRSAKLPANIGEFSGLKTVEQVSAALQGMFKISLALCVFNVLTVLSFRDDQILLHTGAGTTQVPLINAAISPGMFAVVVPFIILVFQLYFDVYVHLLWKELSYLPAFFPDGLSIDRRIYPTLFNSYVRLHVARLREQLSDWI